MELNRRLLLASVPALLASAKARALTLDDSNANVAELLANRCGVTSEHARMLAEADKILMNAGYSETERKTVLTALECPVCGCKVMAAVKAN